MQAPMNEYYTDEEYQYALKQMYRMMERNRILAEAKLAITAKNQLKDNFNNVLSCSILYGSAFSLRLPWTRLSTFL